MNEKWPMRRFIYAINLGTRWIVTYEHGGVGNHYHVIYLDTKDYKSISASSTLLNAGQIHDWVWDRMIQEIKKRPFATIVNEDDFHLINGKVTKNYNMF